MLYIGAQRSARVKIRFRLFITKTSKDVNGFSLCYRMVIILYRRMYSIFSYGNYVVIMSPLCPRIKLIESTILSYQFSYGFTCTWIQIFLSISISIFIVPPCARIGEFRHYLPEQPLRHETSSLVFWSVIISIAHLSTHDFLVNFDRSFELLFVFVIQDAPCCRYSTLMNFSYFRSNTVWKLNN